MTDARPRAASGPKRRWRAAKQSIKGLTEQQAREEFVAFDALWSELFPAEQARIVRLLVKRIEISERGADITIRVEGLADLMRDLKSAEQTKDAA